MKPVIVLAVAMAVAAVLCHAGLSRRFVVVTVRGVSMEPTYHDGDQVLVRRNVQPTAGQVVVFEQGTGDWLAADAPAAALTSPRRHWMIKRVAAVPGDAVPRAQVLALHDVPEDRVPAGQLVLLGDNDRAALDSRQVGYFAAESLLGVVLWRISARRRPG
ncbi:S26 family signal peptidase [Micromonospora peucetia]|uniref:Signal peptidase I n=1 Tax=Micromonospora peucetia TaxID=47871 RepID=A0A1C6VUM4_9ACTN|nr:S26 family signal peptidase [Micromonospora peucetia]SCL69887.1 signal peptidase I [Micromonospora peucetia]